MKVNLYTNNWIKYDLHNSLIELFQRFFCLLLFFGSCHAIEPKVKVGVDNLFVTENIALLKGKRVGLITNHTAICGKMNSTIDLLRKNQDVYGYKITAFFAPEHGLEGALHAGEHVEDITLGGIPVYSLHGKTRRPTEKMLKNIDVLIYDIQDIGSRSYTYLTILLYAMRSLPNII